MMHLTQSRPSTSVAALASVCLLGASLPATEWFDDFTSGSVLDGYPVRWLTPGGGSKGSYDASGGHLAMTFGPCPGAGLSLDLFLETPLAGNGSIRTEARRSGGGGLFVFACGEGLYGETVERTFSGYRGLLTADGRLQLLRMNMGARWILGEAVLEDFDGDSWYSLQLDVLGDDLRLMAWKAEGDARAATRLTASDSTYRVGYYGIGFQEPETGAAATFSYVRIAEEATPLPSGQVPFLRGDVDGDGSAGFIDAVRSLSYLFQGQGRPPCLEALDTDDNGKLELLDPLATLRYLFLSGSPAAEPSTACGIDPTPDGLGCDGYSLCD